MRVVPEFLSLPEGVFLILRDLIRERTGLYYENNKRVLLGEKLSPRVLELGLDSFLDYYYLLKYDDNTEEEWRFLIDTIVVSETFFWREIDGIQALVNVLLPEYLKIPKVGNSRIRIWSAACATGEEPLTIAMALNEGGWFEKLPIEIYASDVCSRAIAKARSGIYRERSFRNLSPDLKGKYFTQVLEGWQVSPALHKRIHWTTANLVSPSEIERLTHANFIFCRNVFIYFSEPSIRQTVELFVEGMPIPGYLFVGAAESLLKFTNQLELQEIGGAFVYVKK